MRDGVSLFLAARSTIKTSPEDYKHLSFLWAATGTSINAMTITYFLITVGGGENLHKFTFKTDP